MGAHRDVKMNDEVILDECLSNARWEIVEYLGCEKKPEESLDAAAFWGKQYKIN